MEFLDLVESIRAEEANVRRLFESEGTPVRNMRKNPKYMANLVEATKLVADVYSGRLRPHYLSEAMTTSDFPYLFGDIIDRQLLANYQEAPYSWNKFCHKSIVPDFRQVRRLVMNGAEGTLDLVPERDEYPQVSMTDARYTYAVQKYGKTIPISWETIINDDLQAFRDIPERFGKSCRRTEEKFATSLFFGSTGPNATFFSDTNNNLVHLGATPNPPLSMASLEAAMGYLLTMKDADGQPIQINRMTLIVPPQLMIRAGNLINSRETWYNEGPGTTNEQVHIQNWLRGAGIIDMAVNYYIPIVATTNGATSWMLVADPNEGRPAAELGFLRGWEQPQVFIKVANMQPIGAGAVNPLDGDFDTDSILYKVRHVLGGTLIDPRMAVASNGSGS